jgi:hypothetical protein
VADAGRRGEVREAGSRPELKQLDPRATASSARRPNKSK